MRNKNYFILSVIVLSLCSIGTIYFAIIDSISLSNLCLAGIMIGTIMLIHWSTISYNWICSKCNNNIEITMWQNFKGMNIGVNKKYLFCPKCDKKVLFKGIKK